MTGPVRKKLIEVAIPLAAINEASAKEKSIRHGHPSTLHLWWARRPLAACRAVLFAQFVDDPASVPEEFPDEASQEAERKRLFGIIERLVPWRNSDKVRVIRDARREIARSVARSRGEALPSDGEIDAYLAANAPPVVDPFCGGGSIPLEAQRLGLRAHGSDLNPVAVLITKAMVDIPSRFDGQPAINPEADRSLGGDAKVGQGATGLAADVRYYGHWMRDEAERRIGHLYPSVAVSPEMVAERPDLKPFEGHRLTLIACVWARTVASPNPAAKGTHVPLVSSFVLSSKEGSEAVVVPFVDGGHYRFTVKADDLASEDLAAAREGTKNGRGANFTCLVSGAPISSGHVKAEGMAGRIGSRLMAVVAEGKQGRVYFEPSEEVVGAARQATPEWRPKQDMPRNPRWFSPPDYGMPCYGDLFIDRQLVALTAFSDLVAEARDMAKRDYLATVPSGPNDDVPLTEGGSGAQAYADAVATYLAFAVDKSADYWNTIATWMPRGTVGHAFARQAIPMTWDFPEANPFSAIHCAWTEAVGWVANAVGSRGGYAAPFGNATCMDARAANQRTGQHVICTDPPYYDNIGYADLSDFFYVWLRRSLGTVYPDLFRTVLTPKKAELVATPYRFGGDGNKARTFFETGLGQAMSRMRSAHTLELPMTLFYAYKQAESVVHEDGAETAVSTGWETMLSGIVENGFVITGTWPLRTERGARSVAMNTNALASSIVLVCRPRSANAPVAARRDFTSALARELPEAIRRLQTEGIAPVDLAQAAVGPGMAVFSGYAEVLEASGKPMTVRGALVEINRVLDEAFSEVEGDMDPGTRFCVAWFEQYGVDERSFGEAEVLFTAKNVAFEGLRHAGVIVGGGGKVRLRRRDELETGWDPVADTRITDWECAQHLVRAMTAESGGGVFEAARLAAAMGSVRAETARRLAYRLHAVSERKGWTAEARAYNVLATSWPQIQSAMVELRQGQQTQLPV